MGGRHRSRARVCHRQTNTHRWTHTARLAHHDAQDKCWNSVLCGSPRVRVASADPSTACLRVLGDASPSRSSGSNRLRHPYAKSGGFERTLACNCHASGELVFVPRSKRATRGSSASLSRPSALDGMARTPQLRPCLHSCATSTCSATAAGGRCTIFRSGSRPVGRRSPRTSAQSERRR